MLGSDECSEAAGCPIQSRCEPIKAEIWALFGQISLAEAIDEQIREHLPGTPISRPSEIEWKTNFQTQTEERS